MKGSNDRSKSSRYNSSPISETEGYNAEQTTPNLSVPLKTPSNLT